MVVYRKDATRELTMTEQQMSLDLEAHADTDTGTDVTCCPVCDAKLRCERRGGDWYCWCAQGPWGNGCSGMDSFGDSAEQAAMGVYDRFNSI